ncbi:virginiamycin A acetyltransferase [Seinonella peptonophila]|uniref:Virginiamycin A acetyltransferase n=1 Tax=Seinonella peptonophila TaxID=112248 RepID=A0A1M4STW8_9BACL|nr:virginiamycin A acetyltransferase [Seinonella peptonophila]
MIGPNPNVKYPIKGNQNVQFIKPTITRPNIIAGNYSYYSARNGEHFEDQVQHHYEFIGDQLIIGKFCSIAAGTTFIMDGANHRMDGSTYPFNIFGHGWEQHSPSLDDLPLKGGIRIGNDVWIGQDATILSGVTIGDGAIIATQSVVTRSVEPYTIVGGNPAKPIRTRFSKENIDDWLAIRWWDWEIELISKHINFIMNGDINQLKSI